MEKCKACGSGESENVSGSSGGRQSSTLSVDVSGDGDGDGFSSETPSFRREDDDLEVGMGTGTTSEGSSPLGWLPSRSDTSNSGSSTTPLPLTGGRDMVIWEERSDKLYNDLSEVELMKERFAKLLLGEDMSDGGKGVCTALAISNVITNLSGEMPQDINGLELIKPRKHRRKNGDKGRIAPKERTVTA